MLDDTDVLLFKTSSMKTGLIVSLLGLALPAAAKAQPEPAPVLPPSASPTDALFELRMRFEAGAISKHEYAAQRKAMLAMP